MADAFLCPGRWDHHSALHGFHVAVARVVAESLHGAVDLGETLAAFDGVLPVRGGVCEGDEREDRED